MRTAGEDCRHGLLQDGSLGLYFSPDSSYYSSPGCEVSALSPTLYDEPVNRSRVIDTISNPSVPKHVIQPFHLLSTSLAEFRAEETAEEVVKLSSCASEAVETPEKASS
ncbi:hypothetical protein VNO80_11186 [Phaseolus coccineus]|uniref:Uncharacterized protein n=1 Tax=Phaseolus coccineus TaxID=3886 RepID=A0AAN9REK3_PHACN